MNGRRIRLATRAAVDGAHTGFSITMRERLNEREAFADSLHFHFTRTIMRTEWTWKCQRQRFDAFLFRRWLAFGLALTHRARVWRESEESRQQRTSILSRRSSFGLGKRHAKYESISL